jgi:hypothetical protein
MSADAGWARSGRIAGAAAGQQAPAIRVCKTVPLTWNGLALIAAGEHAPAVPAASGQQELRRLLQRPMLLLLQLELLSLERRWWSLLPLLSLISPERVLSKVSI